MAGALGGSSLAKHLASCNKTTRDKALRLLKTWLPSQHLVSDEEMKKIWKGLFYCVWHADKQPVQIELINRLSSLLVSLDLPLSIQYFEVFLTTMRREWSGIDFLRLDKFYLLIRRFLHHLFLLLKKNSWDLELTTRLMCVLEEKTLLIVDKYPAQGVNYHICEVFLEELKQFLPLRLEIFDVLLKPFFAVMERSLDKVLLNKIKSSMFLYLLKHGKKLLEIKKSGNSDVSGADDEVEIFGSLTFALAFSTKFFNLGSSSDCVQGNRKILFGLHEDFLKLEKDLANAGVEVSIPQVNEDSVDEVPDLIPIPELKVSAPEVSSAVSNGSIEKPSKKSKKTKKASVGTKKIKKNKKASSDSIIMELKDKIDDNDENVSNGKNLPIVSESVIFDEFVMSNLQMQFEKVAAEVGMDVDGSNSCVSPVTPINGTVSKKRKRVKSIDGQQASHNSGLIGQNVVGGSAIGKSGEKSTKKVRFSMKNNLVWKPHSPLPPQDLRLPPSATPRGSALKKGIPPGPIRETPVAKKVKRKASSVKKARKGAKSVSPAVKRLRKLRAISV